MHIVQALVGIGSFIGIAFLLSENKKQIRWKMIAGAIILQLIVGLILNKVPVFTDILSGFNQAVLVLNKITKAGTAFVFGYLSGGSQPFEVVSPQNNFILAFEILPVIIVVSALSSLLFHWGVLQKVILFFSWMLRKSLKIDGPTGTGVASSIFFGIIESPLFIRPYLATMPRSSLFTLLTAGMATVAGSVLVLYSVILEKVVPGAATQILIASVMSAPAAIMMGQILIPSDEITPEEEQRETLEIKSETKSSFEAIMNGTNDGISMVIGIAATLLVLFAFIELINLVLALIPSDQAITIQGIAGYFFYPFMWLMGVSTENLMSAGQLMGTKLMLNEFVSYSMLSGNPLSLAKDNTIMLYAMCGFANFGSLGILIGGLGTIIPERKNEVASLGLKAILAGTLATMLTGTIAGLLV
jgi:CNT family concentrative nucleoside transporter